MLPATDLRAGMVIREGGELYRVVAAEYHAGGGKMQGVVHAKLRNLRTANFTERRYRPDDRVEEVLVERRPMEFLYENGESCTFMDPETFEQVSVPNQSLGSFLKFLTPNQRLDVAFLDAEPVEVIYPPTVVLRVESTAEPIRGQQDSNVYKSATLENGLEVLVPQFIKPGDLVRVDVETGRYTERVREES